jgi:hypothetical protein
VIKYDQILNKEGSDETHNNSNINYSSNCRLTKHHIKPRSRGGGNGDNIVLMPLRIHEAWHTIFGNLTLAEVYQFIKIVFEGKGRKQRKRSWTAEELYKLQLKLQAETLALKRRQKRKN